MLNKNKNQFTMNIKVQEKEKLIKYTKENIQYIKEIYEKNIDIMNSYGINYEQFVIFCYLYK